MSDADLPRIRWESLDPETWEKLPHHQIDDPPTDVRIIKGRARTALTRIEHRTYSEPVLGHLVLAFLAEPSIWDQTVDAMGFDPFAKEDQNDPMG